jgi:hypothetical protein
MPVTITTAGTSPARGFFEDSAAELGARPDMAVAVALAARHGVEAMAAG